MKKMFLLSFLHVARLEHKIPRNLYTYYLQIVNLQLHNILSVTQVGLSTALAATVLSVVHHYKTCQSPNDVIILSYFYLLTSISYIIQVP